MEKGDLIKQINTLHSLVKATRAKIIRDVIRDKKEWAAKVTRNSSNLRAKRRAETFEAMVNHIKSIPSSELLEEVLRYQPVKHGIPAPLAHRTIARFMQDAKLNRYLKSIESQFGAGAHSMFLDAVQQKQKIKSSVNKKRIKQVQIIKKKLPKQKRLKHIANKKQKTKSIEEDLLQGTDDKKKQTTLVCDVSESDVDFEELDMGSDESLESDGEEELDQRSELNMSVSEDEHYSSNEGPLDHCATRLGNPEFNNPNQSSLKNKKQTNKKKLANYKTPEEEDDKDGYQMITDSFFITDSGEQYVAVAPKFKPQADDDVEKYEESWKLNNRKRRREQHTTNAGDTEAYDTDWNQPEASKVSVNHVMKSKSTRYEEPHMFGSSFINEQDLHPSWAAKQAQKGIKPFAGKRVLFDAEGDGGSSTTYNQQATGKFKTQNGDLHPSWAAKQAQKGIKPFAGKKVLFDAEGDGGSSTTYNQQATGKFKTQNGDLHPSWAAKQAQKGIKPFAGKKVLFDAEGDGGSSSNQAPNKFKAKNGDLHPSWTAKQAQKGLKSFTGKKTVFNDGDGN
ncbi:uncharacterized protein LOC125763664 isoform X8 [Anopheles funestus]|uniref:uncharacterized protein LOC125763664 isoform X8 n=1 Tax=Anopheles funestus TaxID=62324 RepID=UPI0020C5C93F|nr:uncharacterized protein LOC125763664 isoform X8 [Anopheles funestus]